MITTCTYCQKKHQLNIDNITGPAAKYKCLDCGRTNIVRLDGRSERKGLADSDAFEEAKASSTVTEAQGLGEQKEAPAEHPRISGFSIKTKLTLTIIALIVISLTSVSLITSLKGEAALTKQAVNHLMLTTNLKAREYNNIFSRLRDELKGMTLFAKNTFLLPETPQDLDFKILMPWTGKSYGDPGMLVSYRREIISLQHIGVALHGLVRNNPYLELGYFATPNNVMVLDDDKVVDVIAAEKGYIPSKRPWYTKAVEQGAAIWTQPYVDVNTKKLIVSCAAPVYDNDKNVLGVLGFDVLLDTIQKDIVALDIGYASQGFLLGRNADFLAKPGMTTNNAWNQAVKTDNALETDNKELKETIVQMTAGKSGVGVHTDAGSTLIVSYAPIPAIDASLGITISQNEVMKPATEIRKLVFVIWGAAVVLSIVIGLMVGNGITKPINELSRQADLISQGKSDLNEISSRRKDEIGLLVESYNRLIASLRIAMSRRR